MKKQYKLYHNIIDFEDHSQQNGGKIIIENQPHNFRIVRFDVCTCDDLYVALELSNIIHDRKDLNILIEEVEVDDNE